MTRAPKRVVPPDVEPLNKWAGESARKGKFGCLFCPVLPSINGVLIGKDYTGTGGDPERVCQHRMPSEGSSTPDVLIVLESPDAREDRENIPFSSRAADKIRASWRGAGLKDEQFRMVYAARCSTYDLGTTSKERAVAACNLWLSREVRNCEPKIVLTVGAGALKAIVGKGYNIASCAGVPFKHKTPDGLEIVVLPMISPGQVFYDDSKGATWDDGWDRLEKMLSGQLKLSKGMGEYREVKSAREAARMLDSYVEGDVAFDYETNCLNPFGYGFRVKHTKKGPVITEDFEDSTIAIVSWSDKPGRGFYVLRDHYQTTWTAEDRKVFDRSFKSFVTRKTVRKVIHNAPFEKTWTLAKFGVRIVNSICTLYLHHQSDEESSHALDNVATQVTGMGNWKTTIERVASQYGHNYRHVPKEIVGPYAGADADATLRILRFMEPKLDKARLRIVRNFHQGMSTGVASMQVAGSRCDVKYAAQFEEWTAARKMIADTRIRQHSVVRRYVRHKERKDPKAHLKSRWTFNPNSPTQIRELLFTDKGFGYEPFKFSTGSKTVEDWDGTDEEYDSPMPDVGDSTEGAKTDADTLKHFVREKNCTFSALLLDWRKYDKQHGTYAVSLDFQAAMYDGYIRGSFNPAGTVTGRASSSDPNLQNQPFPTRRHYISRFRKVRNLKGFRTRGVILSIDYSQIELRVAAALSGEKRLLKLYREGADVHDMNMCRIFGFTPEFSKELKQSNPAEHKKKRTIAKRISFGVLYGIGPEGIVNSLRAEDVIISVEEAATYIDAFFSAYPTLKKWMDDVVDFTYRNGYALSPFGRRRHLPHIRSSKPGLRNRAGRQAPNAVIQGAASDLTWTALVIIEREIRKRGLRSKVTLQVHDNIVVDCPPEEVEEVTSLSLEIMENLPKHAGREWPGLDWSWLTCPIVAEAEVGPSWRDGAEYKPGMDIAEALKKAHEKMVARDTRMKQMMRFVEIDLAKGEEWPHRVELLQALQPYAKEDKWDSIGPLKEPLADRLDSCYAGLGEKK